MTAPRLRARGGVAAAEPPLNPDELAGQVALFTLGAAFDAGFSLRTPGAGCLDVLVPLDVAREVREPLLAAIETHKNEIIGVLRLLDDEAERGIVWSPPERDLAQ